MKSKVATLAVLTMGICLTAPAALRAQGTTPSAAVEGFFKAASDSNLKAMGRFFGTAKGPASVVNTPGDWEKRIAVMNTLFNGIKVRALSESEVRDPDQRTVTTQLSRGRCEVTLAVQAVRTSAGWVVREFDLSQAQTVNRVCEGGALAGNTGN